MMATVMLVLFLSVVWILAFLHYDRTANHRHDGVGDTMEKATIVTAIAATIGMIILYAL